MAEMTPEEEEALRRDVAQAFPGHQGPQLFEQNDLTHIKHVIGVVSGKGGVGKSLVSGLLATEPAAAPRSASWTPTLPAPPSPRCSACPTSVSWPTASASS